MNANRRATLGSFLGASGTIILAATLTRLCPGGCSSCATCAVSGMSMAAGAAAVGGALGVSRSLKRRSRDIGTPHD